MTLSASPSPWRRIASVLAACLGGALLQFLRLLGLLLLALRCRLAAAQLRRASRRLGEAMYGARVGDQRVLQRLEALDLPTVAPARPEEQAGRQHERRQLQEQLGDNGLEAGVPLLAVEQVHQRAAAVRVRGQALERSRAGLASRIWPSSLPGWVTLLCSYAITAAAVVLLVRLLPARKESGPPTIEAVLEGKLGAAEVKVEAVRITRAQFRRGEQIVTGDAEDCLITLRLTNVGTVPVEYRSWRGRDDAAERDFATLVDSAGMSLRGVHYKGGAVPQGGVRTSLLEPGDKVEDVLIFVRPTAGVSHLQLFLPAGNVGASAGTPPLKLTIPASRIERTAAP